MPLLPKTAHKLSSILTASPRLIAFYLPQFHPIPENDIWWGKGFTEWTNVTQARRLFSDHYQPHIPADLGFYDLRLSEAREAQAELALRHGINGFCYYHYWFNGRRLLHQPFDDVLASGRPDFPFCLCWANENWTRTWDGQEQESLLAQQHSEEDDRAHIEWLCRAFADPRYIRVNGKPLISIYRASRLPDALRTCELWREGARAAGIGEIFLCRVESLDDERGDPVPLGFDSAIEFQPDWPQLGTPLRRTLPWRVGSKLGIANRAYRRNRIYDYKVIVETMLLKKPSLFPRIPCVTPSWDNSARRKSGAVILRNSTPLLYQRWLEEVLRRQHVQTEGTGLVFINAWNEWAEGCHLEPCQRWGLQYLEATVAALQHDNFPVDGG